MKKEIKFNLTAHNILIITLATMACLVFYMGILAGIPFLIVLLWNTVVPSCILHFTFLQYFCMGMLVKFLGMFL